MGRHPSDNIGSIILSFLVLVFIGVSGWAQENLPRARMLGLLYGYGGENINIAHLEHPYIYEVHLLQLQWSQKLLSKGNFDVDVILTPQINRSRFRHQPTDLVEYHGTEFGVTAGIAPKLFFIQRNLGLVLLLSSGPVYLSAGPDRQAKGVNFSSNAQIGLQIKISKGLYIQANTGFRHLSNANLSEPNGGLNSVLVTGGIAMVY